MLPREKENLNVNSELMKTGDSMKSDSVKSSYCCNWWNKIAKKCGSTVKAVNTPTIESDTVPLDNYIDVSHKRLFKKALSVKDSFNALDVGCGYGRLTLWVAPSVKRIVGMDISTEMISLLKEEAKKKGLKNVEAYTTPASDIPQKSDSFDLVFAFGIIKLIVDKDAFQKAVEEMSRVTIQGGRVALLDTMHEPTMVIVKNINDDSCTLMTEKEYLSNECNGILWEVWRPPSAYINEFKKHGLQLIALYGVFLPPYPRLIYERLIRPLGPRHRKKRWFQKINRVALKLCYSFSYHVLDRLAHTLLREKSTERLLIFQKDY